MPRNRDDRIKYRKDFPFVDWFYTVGPGTLKTHDPDNFASVEIKVKQGTPDLMYRQSQDAGPWEVAISPAIVRTAEPHYEGQQCEYLFVVLTDGVVSTEMRIGVKEGYPESCRYNYVREVFTKYPFARVEYLVWVSIQNWYDTPEDHVWSLAPGVDDQYFVERTMKVTIYKPPRDGWSGLYRRARLGDTYLTTRPLLRGIVSNDPDWLAISDRLDQLAEAFESRVYLKGMRDKIDSSEMKGMASQWGNVKVMTYAALGRVMITLDEPRYQITFMAAEDGEPRMGINAVDGPLPQLERIVKTVIKGWEASEDPASSHNDERGFSPWPFIPETT